MTTSNLPVASRRRVTFRVAAATAPTDPRLARLRTKTWGRSAIARSIRTRSPSTAPPLIGLEGSTAITAARAPCSEYASMSRATSVLLPAPGGPVTPITCDGRAAAGISIDHGGVFLTSVIARASGSQLRAPCWASSSASRSPVASRSRARSAGSDKGDLPVQDALAHHALRGLADARERQAVDKCGARRPLEAGQLRAAEAQQVARPQRGARHRHRDHHRRLAPPRVRDADHYRARDRGVPAGGGLHLGRRHVQAAADDQVLEAAGEGQGPVLVELAEIA